MSYASGATNGTLVIGGLGAGLNNTQLNSPIGVYFDSISNYLFIGNFGGQNIVRCALGDTSWTQVAGAVGVIGSSSTLLSFPTGVTLDPMGNMYVADAGNHRVQFYLAGQTTGTTIAGITGLSGTNSTQLYNPYSVRLDSQLNLYVADANNHRVQKFLRY